MSEIKVIEDLNITRKCGDCRLCCKVMSVDEGGEMTWPDEKGISWAIPTNEQFTPESLTVARQDVSKGVLPPALQPNRQSSVRSRADYDLKSETYREKGN